MRKLSLLDKWRNRKKTAAPDPVPATPTGDYAASTGQQRLYVLDRLSPGNPFYNYAEQYLIDGALDAEVLRQAITTVFARHEVLRSTFYQTDDEVRQRVGTGPGFSWRYVSDAVSEEDVLAEATLPFDLENGPLTRILLVRQAAEKHLLVITQHHIITDKQSMRILCEEMAMAYAALRRGATPSLSAPVQTYGQFADRQRATLSEEDLGYWRERLAGAPALLDLPTDFPRPARQSYRGKYARASLDEALSEAVRERCREEGITPYVYLLSAYLVLLYRYSGQSDLLVGTPVSNRDTVELERLIGFFNETLVLRNEVRRDMPFADLVTAVRQRMMEAFAHKNVAFEAVVRSLNPERRAGANPLFQSMFILHRVPDTLQLDEGLEMVNPPLDLGVTKFDLTLFVADLSDRFGLIFEYATDLFAESRIRRMLDQYAQILRQVTERPQLPVGEVALVTAAEVAPPPAPAQSSADFIDRKILESAAARPGAVAVSTGSERLTYAELAARSLAVAAELRQRGVGPGNVVGLHVGRSTSAVVGLLGILRAGAAYLPLDPVYPAERRRFMLKDSGATVVVTDGSGQDLATGRDLDLLDLNGLLPRSGAQLESFDRSPDDAVYLIYTSGSSGKPKGVPVSHRNLAHSNDARREVYGGAPGAFLLLSSFSFDSSVAGIFWTLCGGGKLVVSAERAEQDPAALAKLICREDVTHTLLLPTLYRQLLEFAEPGDLHSLSTVIVAGEACTGATVRQHFARLPSTQLYNEYGPTEATVWATVHRVRPEDAGESVPIGSPVPNYRILLLDDGRQPVPKGVPGEICIAGPGLTAGYLNRPELTADRFVELALPGGESLRVYRTGDLGVRREDGALLFLGRGDHQVKVRGYRVELGEVREQMLHDAEVSEAEVVVGPTGSQLVAYAVLAEGADVRTLTDRLRERMPAYMVPARVVAVEAFPRLPNGKVDLQALARIAETSPASAPTRQEAPASPTEQRLLEIWREVLGQEDIGVADNFFALGGDSILSIRILARARRTGIELPATAIFDRQTIRELAVVARDRAAAPATTEGGHHGPVPLTPIQHWFFAEHVTAPHFWNHAWWLRPGGKNTAERLRQATEELCRGQEALRLQFSRQADGQWQARIAPPDRAVPFAVRQGEEGAPEAYWLDFQDAVDLDRDPLFRVILCETPTTRRVLVWAHHLVVDMVSWDRILEALTGQPAVGGDAYHRWANQLERWGSGKKFDADLPFWRQQRCSAIRTELSGRLPVPQSSVATQRFTLDESTTSALLQAANEAYGTRAEELLLTALVRTVSDYVEGPEACLNLERHGREALDSDLSIGETVGWFTVSYPLAFPLANSGVGGDIVAIKERLRSVPDQGIGYGVLRYLGGHTELDQQPQLFFNYLGQATGATDEDRPRFVDTGLRAPEGEVNRTWEINAVVRGGRLEIAWSFSKMLHRPATVTALGQALVAEVSLIVQHCLEREEQQFTPSDFPEASLSQDDLDGLLDQLGG